MPEHASDKALSTEAAAGGDDAIVAVRGTTCLTELDLRGHIASLLELPNVAVLLGAGASKTAGCKTISEIKAKLDEAITEDKTVEASAELLRQSRIPLDDVERTWSILTNLGALNQSGRSVVEKQLADAAEKYEGTLLRSLLDSAQADQSKTGTHRSLLRKLVLSRQPGQPAPWVFTTNYDLAVELAAEEEGILIVNGFSGLHQRSFDPRLFDLGWYSTAARGEARFGTIYAYLAKLHGSLSWTETQGEIAEQSREMAMSAIEAFKKDTSRQCPCVLIPPSAGKYLDTVGFIQGEMFRRLAEFVDRSNTCLLVCGYSWSDAHLDRLLLGGLRNPTFHLLVTVYGCEVDKNGCLKGQNAGDRLNKLNDLKHPNVTIVAGAPADFENLVKCLPDPALLDEQARDTERRVRELVMYMGRTGTKGGGSGNS